MRQSRSLRSSDTLMHVRRAKRMTENFGIDVGLRDTYNAVDYDPPSPDFNDLLKQIK